MEEKTELYLRLEQAACLHYETATKEEILKLDEFVAPLFKKHFKHTKKVKRIVDFNQGIDARLIMIRIWQNWLKSIFRLLELLLTIGSKRTSTKKRFVPQ